jgi:hypothetical protein
MRALGWHYVDDPANEPASMVEFSLGQTSSAATNHSRPRRRGNVRRVRIPPSSFAIWAIFAVIVAIAVTSWRLYDDYRMRVFDRAGTVVTGVIENTYSTVGRGNTTHWVDYKFADRNGNYHDGEDEYPFRDWNSLHKGEPISVGYLPENPQRNYLRRRIQMIASRNFADELPGFSFVWLIAAGFFLAYRVRQVTWQAGGNTGNKH